MVSPPPTLEFLRAVFQEGKDVVRAQTESLRGLDEKAAQLLRFDALLLGVVAAVAPGVTRGPSATGSWWGVAGLGAGAALLLFSAGISLVAYRARSRGIGLQVPPPSAVASERRDERAFLEGANEAYALIGATNAAAIWDKARRLEAAMWVLVAALCLLAASSAALILARGLG